MRVCGEWLAQAHGTRYELNGRQPFVAFDVFSRDNERLPTEHALDLILSSGLAVPKRLQLSNDPLSIDAAMALIANEYRRGYGELDEVEGAVWRVERRGKFDFLAKYVRPDKIDGLYLPEISGQEPIWNWRP
jgi:hypothetical protein